MYEITLSHKVRLRKASKDELNPVRKVHENTQFEDAHQNMKMQEGP